MRYLEYITRALSCATLLLMSSVTHAAELVMIETQGCVYCTKFNREIAPAYPKTEEGKIAPLRRIQLGDKWPVDLKDIRPENLTPTFVLVDNGKEVDRLVGYPGDEHFWFLLTKMLEKL